ncbi:hypothetical protein [Nostoc sp. FACHB-280]|nr:hypothetical protein [Nostoc sp. FACHB-280]
MISESSCVDSEWVEAGLLNESVGKQNSSLTRRTGVGKKSDPVY